MPTSDGQGHTEEHVTLIDSLKNLFNSEKARQRRLALKKRELLLNELAALEDEYELPRTKPARHKNN